MIVTVDEVKTHLRIEHNEEDGYIGDLIRQAQAEAEDYCRVSFEKRKPSSSSRMLPETEPPETEVTLPP